MRKLDYIRSLLKKVEDNELEHKKRKSDYCGRHHEMGHHWGLTLRSPLYGCEKCNFTTKNNFNKCPNCGEEVEIFNLGHCAKPPRKKASKKKWKIFWDTQKKLKKGELGSYWMRRDEQRGEW